MNILYIANYPGLFGANRSLMEAINYLKQNGHNIYVFLPQNGDLAKELRRKHIKFKVINYKRSVHEINKKKFGHGLYVLANNVICALKCQRLLKSWKIDIIHTNSITENFGAILSLLFKIPHVWHIREMLQRHYKLTFDSIFLQKYLMKHASKIIYISNVVCNYYDIFHLSNIIVLYDGFDCSRYDIERKVYFENNTIRIITCGVISQEKNQLDAVKAVCYLKNKNIEVELTIVGTCMDKVYLKRIKELVEKHHLKQYVRILPFQNDLRHLREHSDIELICSKGEALGRVTIEAMLGELLVIGLNCDGTSELIDDGVNGYTYKPDNIKELAEKVLKAVNDKSTTINIIKNAKIWVEQNFSIEVYCTCLEALYTKIICDKN